MSSENTTTIPHHRRRAGRRTGFLNNMKFIATIVLVLVGYSSYADIIQSSNTIPWVPNVTVGVRGGIPSRTTIYTNFYSSNTVSEIQSGIGNCPSTQVVLLHAGVYNILSGLAITTGITLRGEGTNTILVGHIKVGNDPSGTHLFTLNGTPHKGDTNITFSTNLDQFGSAIAVGDGFTISSTISSTPTFPYIQSIGGEPAESQVRALRQPIILVGISNGTNATITPPLVWDFTNSPTAAQLNFTGVPSIGWVSGVGIENLLLTTTNSGIDDSSIVFMMQMELARDSWITNCSFYNGNNYNVFFEDCIDCTMSHNSVRFSKGGGSNHAGLLTANDSGCLLEDNIIADGLTPGMEWNDGFCGNAVFANFFTNNVVDIDCHNTHPVMNLWEENVTSGFEMDGYFGSASHQTLLRNRVYGTTDFKRWSTYMQAVGNVLGNPSYPFVYAPSNSNYPNLEGYGVFEFGYPNIGNADYDGVSGPIPWNYPGDHLAGFFGEALTNGFFVITNTQVSTNIITGVFTNVPLGNAFQYPLIGQDAVNTNTYWTIGILTNWTSSNAMFATSTTVSNGWRVYIANQNAYQWQQTSNLPTDTVTGNAVYTNSITTPVIVWDAGGVQSIPASLLYTNGAPSWWGSDHWPAIDPTNTTQQFYLIPAQERYLGINQHVNNTIMNSLIIRTVKIIFTP